MRRLLLSVVLVSCPLTPAAAEPAPPALPREFRGVWVATVGNIDWPSHKALPTEQQKAELLAILDRAVELRLNAVIFQVRPMADALYASPLEPWSEYLTGTLGQAPAPLYDPLELAVREAHARGLELHAWFNPYRARHPSATSPIPEDHVIRRRPDLARPYGKHHWLNPTHPDVRDHSLRVILDVVRRYDVDGVHMDDYFYPYKEKDADKKVIPFPDDDTWEEYRRSGGALGRDDWRRAAVNQFVERLYKEVKAAKPWVKVGISPFGIWRPGHPEGIAGLDQYAELYADARRWLNEGWCDYLSPQLYWPIRQEKQSYPRLLAWWVGENTKGRHLWPGNYTSRVSGEAKGWPADELIEQLKLTRLQPGAGGNVHFSMKALLHNTGGVADALKAVYTGPALVPATPWAGLKAPAPPRVGWLEGGGKASLRIRPGGEGVRLYVVRSLHGTEWTVRVQPARSEEAITLPFDARPQRVLVSAVDRAGTESPQAEADALTLSPGKWVLIDWRSPDYPDLKAVLTVQEKDGQPAITAVEDEFFSWKPGGLAVNGRHVTFTLTREGPFTERFDGLFDPASPARVLGSFWSGGSVADRAVLERVPPAVASKPKRPAAPPEWTKYLEIAVESGEAAARADGPDFKAKPPAEQAALRAAADAARERYFTEVPKLFRKLVADRPDSPFGHDAAMQLFSLTARVKPTPEEVSAWAKAARTFAATHGPQFEATTLGRIATVLARHAEFAGQAGAYAAKADKLATAAGHPATYAQTVAVHDEERAAWARQTKPPADGSTWTVTLTGRVTDDKGGPVADAEVLVNNTQWVKLLTEDGGYKARTGPDGRYTITLKCQGMYRVHVTRMWAEKRGFIRAENEDRHRLLPGGSAVVDFTLTGGEPFGGTLKLRPDSGELGGAEKSTHLLRVYGPNVEETLVVANGGRFELTLPKGTYTAEVDRGGGKKLTWAGLKTGRTDHVLEEPPFRFTPETVGAGFDALWQAMDRDYSYFTLKPDINWARLRDEYRPKAVKAKSADELAAVLKGMLATLKDGHVWIEMPGGKVIGTHRTEWSYNGNRKAVLAQLTDVTECGAYAVVGKTKPDGFGYFLMTRQSAATPALVARATAAIEKLADAPGFVIDLRNANGGSEPLAQDVARLFCGAKVVYAKSKFRSGKGHDEFTDDYPRELRPARSGKPFLKPVVCLIGPGCVSSGEGFAKMMAALPHVTTVGLPTRGSSGNPAPAEVGDTGVVVYFSRWVDMLPNGTPIEGKGVPAAVRVERPAEAYKDADPTLERGLDVLKDMVRKTRPK